MHSTSSTQKLRSIVFILFALTGVIAAWISSYRLGFISVEFAWQLNLDRTAAASAAGLALGSVGVVFGHHAATLRFHVIGFAIISLMTTAAILSSLFGAAWFIIILISLPFGYVAYFAVERVTRFSRYQNVWFAFILTLSFVLTAASFLLASSLDNLLTHIVFWLQGDLSSSARHSTLALVLSVLLFLWMTLADSKQNAAILLLSLGVGIAGPMFLVASLIPPMVNKLIPSRGRLWIASCGAFGALFLVLADVIPRLFLGGYAPTLIIPIAIVAIPLLLWSQRTILLHEFPSRTRAFTEAAIVLLWTVGFAFLLFHVVQFASLAT